MRWDTRQHTKTESFQSLFFSFISVHCCRSIVMFSVDSIRNRWATEIKMALMLALTQDLGHIEMCEACYRQRTLISYISDKNNATENFGSSWCWLNANKMTTRWLCDEWCERNPFLFISFTLFLPAKRKRKPNIKQISSSFARRVSALQFTFAAVTVTRTTRPILLQKRASRAFLKLVWWPPKSEHVMSNEFHLNGNGNAWIFHIRFFFFILVSLLVPLGGLSWMRERVREMFHFLFRDFSCTSTLVQCSGTFAQS